MEVEDLTDRDAEDDDGEDDDDGELESEAEASTTNGAAIDAAIGFAPRYAGSNDA